ncbi:cytochrome P450 [Guyanagaster necrorhizus]|uniref:Cytochrome P450 n=1 Tax=Guyanagaster necrorhizus TaxID=856835 RepID=A0A9P7VGF0_9AGAR|nr:cytochrome P450 [Guyanagaster necrorhizus MCA 3950]KAG7440087.1 cytochrome P450 [Guyanagaster necrorhizus MCA 3950]
MTMIYLDIIAGIISIALAVLLHLRRSQSWQLSLPPGPKKRFLIGNLKDMPTSFEWETYHRWGKEHDSDIIHLDVVGTSIIVLNSLEATSDLLDKRSSIYSSRAHLSMVRELMGWDFLVGLMPYGNDWRAHRRLCQQTLNAKAALHFHPQVLDATRELLRRLLDRPEDFMTHLRYMAARVIMSITYGIDILPDGDPFVAVAEDAMHTVGLAVVPGTFLVDFLPILKYVPEWFPGAGFQRTAKEWKVLARRMVDIPYGETIRQIADGSYKPSFTSSNLDRIGAEQDMACQQRIIKNTAGTMYAAGSDTTVSAFATFILGALFNPEAQRKGQAEIDRVLHQERLPTFDDQESMPYVTAIVKEVLRWKNVTPIAIPHLLEIDDVYKGYRLPAGSVVVPNTWAILHDEVAYPDPFSFNPDRFMKNGRLDLTVKDPTIVAFGYGRRICPGRHLAYASVWITVASILAVFDITKAVDENGMIIEPSDKVYTGLVCLPEPFKCSIKPRSKEAEDYILSSEQ